MPVAQKPKPRQRTVGREPFVRQAPRHLESRHSRECRLLESGESPMASARYPPSGTERKWSPAVCRRCWRYSLRPEYRRKKTGQRWQGITPPLSHGLKPLKVRNPGKFWFAARASRWSHGLRPTGSSFHSAGRRWSRDCGRFAASAGFPSRVRHLPSGLHQNRPRLSARHLLVRSSPCRKRSSRKARHRQRGEPWIL